MVRSFNKKVYAKNGANWSLSSEKKFVYDGYKQIAEYAGTTATMLTVWQPESSGDFDVPLWSKTGTEVQTYIVDGNKNVRQLKNAAGTVIANYDYDPFGNVTATGSVTPWQFSSEYRDEETGLIYYNYRYYAPTIGRWLTRDPITEQGGVNLYGMLDNSSTNRTDFGGLFEQDASHGIIKCKKTDDCISLALSVKGWTLHYLKRYQELLLDKLDLKENSPSDYNNHVTQLEIAQKHIKNCVTILVDKIVNDKCCPPWGDKKIPIFYPKPPIEKRPDPAPKPIAPPALILVFPIIPITPSTPPSPWYLEISGILKNMLNFPFFMFIPMAFRDLEQRNNKYKSFDKDNPFMA